MHEFISDTAAYGDLVSGNRIITEETRKNMKAVLKDIQDGTFAKRWQEESDAGAPNFKKMMEDDIKHPIEKCGAELRKQFSWLKQTQEQTS